MTYFDMGASNNKKGGRIMIEKELLKKVKNQIIEPQEPIFQTGFRDLDILLASIEKSSLVTIGGRPAMGKTSFIVSIMLKFLEQNKKCLFFTLDMSESCFIKRLIPTAAEVDFSGLSRNKLNEIEKEKISAAFDKLSKFNLTIIDDTRKIEGIKEKIEQEKPEIVFIDYLQLFDTPIKKQKNDAIEDIMRSLKKLAKDNNCLIFVLSQLSRAIENRCDKRPMLCDLRDSGSIETISDVVLFIYREEYYNRDIVENKGRTEIIVAKNNFGATFAFELLFRGSIMKFLEPIKVYDF